MACMALSEPCKPQKKILLFIQRGQYKHAQRDHSPVKTGGSTCSRELEVTEKADVTAKGFFNIQDAVASGSSSKVFSLLFQDVRAEWQYQRLRLR